MVMQRWDPVNELRQMENTMNRLWRGFAGVPSYRDGMEDWNIPIDVIQKSDMILVKASLPGFAPDGIDVAVEDNVLTIKAEKKAEIEQEGETYLIHERAIGSYYRALRLPDTVDTGKIQSTFENGVLTISLPKAEEKKRKQIKVKVGGGTKAIEGSVTK